MDAATLKRIGQEKTIVRKTIATLLNAGYLLNVNNGGETNELAAPTRRYFEIVDAMMQADDDRLLVYRQEHTDAPIVRVGWIWFVYGNDGWDVVCDHTTNLDHIMEPIATYCDSLQ
jgi:hypothetical protein